MGKASLRRRGRRKAAVLLVVASLLAPTPALAVLPVQDTGAISELIALKSQALEEVRQAVQQVKLLMDSLNFLRDIRAVMDEVYSAIGELTTITLPITSLPSLKRQAVANWRCLTHFDKLAPGIEFEDIDFGSLCGARSAVRAAVFLKPSDLKNMSESQRYQKVSAMQKQREQIYANSAAEALAAAMAAQNKTLTDMVSTFDQLQSSARSAQTVQQHLAVGNQIELARYQADIDLYSMQVNLTRLLAARAIREVSVTAVIPESAE